MVTRTPLEPESKGYKHVIRQMGEMFKNILTKPSDGRQAPVQAPVHPTYQPIVGTVNQIPVMSSASGVGTGYTYPIPSTTFPTASFPPTQLYRSAPYSGQREPRPREEMICFRYGGKGHRASECMNSPLLREEQDRLRSGFNQGQTSRYNETIPDVHRPQMGSHQPQLVAQVDVA